MATPDPPPRGRLVLALAITYVVWGTTYAAIRIGVHDWPPLLFVGLRFTLAGTALLVVARLRGEKLLLPREAWTPVLVLAVLFIAVSNGLASWSEVSVSSDEAALLGATTALWITGLGALGPHGTRLDRWGVAALLLGLVGCVLLLAPKSGWHAVPFTGYLAITLSNLAWAVGVLYGRRPRAATVPLLGGAAWQMLVGGTMLLLFGGALGEGRTFAWSLPGFLTVLYLALAASTLTYTVYLWLVPRVSPLALGSINYINPLVAVVCGWSLLGERLDGLEAAGGAVVLFSVVLTAFSSRRHTDREPSPVPAPLPLTGEPVPSGAENSLS
jgi:drug/metabolite transporter (DMT)-like permease